MPDRVIVTGMGVINAIAEDVPSFSNALQAGQCGITSDGPSNDHPNYDGLGICARIPEFVFTERLAKLNLSDDIVLRARRAAARQPRSVQVSLLTALEAWNSAGMSAANYSPDDISIILAGHNISPADQFSTFQKYQEQPEYISARYALQFLDTNHIGVISEVLGLQGEGFSLGAASASGNMGILQAHRQISLGVSKVCVLVAAMADLSPVEVQAFRQTGAMGGKRFCDEPEQACRPFDEDREGFIYGQGAACMILESAELASARDAPHWGEIAAAAACLDANRLSDPSVEGETRAMRKALVQAGINPSDVDYINAHATSSVLGDQVEIDALGETFGSELSKIWINASKGLFGHCLYASGLVEAAASLIQMKECFLHPNRNLNRPISSSCQFVGHESQEVLCKVALSNAFGFGGINTAVVLRR